jgi:uncharacterized repeat protein (TIGR01451 family)
MRFRFALLIAWVGLLPVCSGAVLNTHDARPAATLLLPYFEVDSIPNFPESALASELVGVKKTVFTIGNASAPPMLARVTLWTDLGIPTLSFDIFLTGYDLESIDLKQTFDGILPPSKVGGMSGCLPLLSTRMAPADIIGLRNAHSGQASSLLGNLCGSRDYGDGALRGFVTVDAVNQCDDTLLPNQAGYSAILDPSNSLWGVWQFFDPAHNLSDSAPLTAIEAGSFAAGDYTFYGRFNAFDGSDNREALGNVWGTTFTDGGVFDGGTSVRVWREPRSVPVPVACPAASVPAYAPGLAREVNVFDDSEQVVSLNTAQLAFPLATQRVRINGPALPVPFASGWLYLNLDSAPGTTKAELKQSYVSAVRDALGRFSLGNEAFRMNHPSAPNPDTTLAVGLPVYPGLTVTKAVSGTLAVGQQIHFTVTVTRTGPGIRNCQLSDVLPSARLSLVSASASSGTAGANLMTNTATWTGTLNDAMPSATIDIVATITASGFVINTAHVDFDNTGDNVADGSAEGRRTFTVP